MIDSWYCLDPIFWLLRELSQCRRALTKFIIPNEVRKTNHDMFLVPFQKKGWNNRSSRFEQRNSWLSFSRTIAISIRVLGWRSYLKPRQRCSKVCQIMVRQYWHTAIPLGVTFSNAVSKLKAQSSKVSFPWNVVKETFNFELWAFENVTPSGPPKDGLIALWPSTNG